MQTHCNENVCGKCPLYNSMYVVGTRLVPMYSVIQLNIL